MAIRDKIRKKFTRGSTTSASSSASSSSSSTLGEDECKFEMYKPGERIPYKYRRPVDPQHKQLLESYCLATAWSTRRKSFASQYSPMASNVPSRRNSFSVENDEMGQCHAGSQAVDDVAEFKAPSRKDTHHSDLHFSDRQDDDLSSAHIVAHLEHSHNNRQQMRNNAPFDPAKLARALERTKLGMPL